MSTHKNLTTLCFASVLMLGLAACGGGGGGAPVTDTGTPMGPDGKPLAFAALAAGATVDAGTYHLLDAPDTLLMALGAVEVPEDGYAAGEEITVGDLIMLKCADSSEDSCSVTVNDDGSFTTTGTILVVAAGGMFPTPPRL